MTDRRRFLLQTLAMTGLSAVAQTCPVRAAPTRLRAPGDDIDVALRAAVDRADIAGVVAMAATAEQVFYQGSFGHRDIRAKPAMSPDTIFRIASMVKLLTSVAALQLVETGKLTLDDPVAAVDPAQGPSQEIGRAH